MDEAQPDQPESRAAAGTIVVLNRDLMFGSRIAAAARSLGLETRFVRDLPGLTTALAVPGTPPALAVIDMNAAIDWGAMADLIAAAGGRVPFLGFGPHVDVAGRRAAKGAGLTRIVSNGDFHRDTAGLIARYAHGDG
jgi:hypothetical protein